MITDKLVFKKIGGYRVRAIREALCMTPEQMATTLKVSLGWYWDCEKGVYQLPSDFLMKLKNQYNVNPSWYYDGVGEMFLPKGAGEGDLGYFQGRMSREDLLLYVKRHTRLMDAIDEMVNFYVQNVSGTVVDDEYLGIVQPVFQYDFATIEEGPPWDRFY